MRLSVSDFDQNGVYLGCSAGMAPAPHLYDSMVYIRGNTTSCCMLLKDRIKESIHIKNYLKKC